MKILEEYRYTISYKEGHDTYKEVVYFLAKIQGDNNIVKQESEIENIFWSQIDEVREKLTYENAKIMWENVYKDIKKVK